MFWNFSKFFPNEPAFSVASLKSYVMQRDDHFFKNIGQIECKAGHIFPSFTCLLFI